MNAYYVFALLVLWLRFEEFLKKLRCNYCGEIAKHTPHCPRNGAP